MLEGREREAGAAPPAGFKVKKKKENSGSHERKREDCGRLWVQNPIVAFLAQYGLLPGKHYMWFDNRSLSEEVSIFFPPQKESCEDLYGIIFFLKKREESWGILKINK